MPSVDADLVPIAVAAPGEVRVAHGKLEGLGIVVRSRVVVKVEEAQERLRTVRTGEDTDTRLSDPLFFGGQGEVDVGTRIKTV